MSYGNNVFTLLIKIGLAIFNFFMLYNIQYNSTAHWTNKTQDTVLDLHIRD